METIMNIHSKGKKRHDSVLREKFGIGLHQYQTMYEEQGGRCYLCGTLQHRNLAVDHCHSTGKVRKLLCSPCNQALGLFYDNADVLRKAAEYVETSFELPEDKEIETKPHSLRARWRSLVHTPNGSFNSFEEAGKAYGVDATTIGSWAGAYAYRMHLKKEGFTYEKVFK